MGHRWPVIILLFSLALPLSACKNYQKENEHLRDELRMVREESDYLKAEIVGLKKEIAALNTRVQEERASMQTRFEEEREQLRKKVQEEREAMQKKIQEATKPKNESPKKDLLSKESGTAKKGETKEPFPKTVLPRPSGSKTIPPKVPLSR